MEDLQQVIGVLGMRKRIGGVLDLIEEIENDGLPIGSLDRVLRLIAPGDTKFKYRIVPRATLSRLQSQTKRLNPKAGAVVARLARIWAAALDAWKGEEQARAFLFRPHTLLDGRRPIDVVLSNELGVELVEDILGRLKYGSAV